MSNNYKDILLLKFEEYEAELAQERKKLLQFEIFEILEKLKTPDSDDLYIWGGTYYLSDYNKKCALRKFLKSYEADSKNFMACLYIAHCYQDFGKLKKALKYYELVSKKELKKFHFWRYVKFIEQIGFCNYKLGQKAVGRLQFLEVLKRYKESSGEILAVPSEMLDCLPESDEIIVEIKKIETYL